MIATDKIFNISFDFLKIRSGNLVKFRKTRKMKNRHNRVKMLSCIFATIGWFPSRCLYTYFVYGGVALLLFDDLLLLFSLVGF